MKPNQKEITKTINRIKSILSSHLIDRADNSAVKSGYSESVRILEENVLQYNDIDPELSSVQARAIAVIAVDYLTGELTADKLTCFPLRSGVTIEL